MNPEERALAIGSRIGVRADPLHRLRKCGRTFGTCDALKAEMLKKVCRSAFIDPFVTGACTDRNGDRDGAR